MLLAIGGSWGAVMSFLYGGDAGQILLWLVIFICVDYASGTVATIRIGEWSSSLGAKGIAKKVFLLGLVALCHGLDALTPAEAISLRDICAFSLAATEFGSILENIDRCGFGYLIPVPVRRAFKAMQEEKKDDGKKAAE